MANQEEAVSREVLNLFTPHSSGGFYATNNQFLKKGTKGFTEWKILKEDMYMRLDFPGVSEENFKASIDESKKIVTVEGEAPQVSPHEEGARSYFSNVFRLVCECCVYSDIKADVRDGVVRLVLSKVKDKNFKGSDGCANARRSRERYKNFKGSDGCANARRSRGDAIVNHILRGETITDESSGQIITESPYVTKGSKVAFESKTTADGELFLRVDMPGVAKKEAKVEVVGGEVRFYGKARRRQHDIGVREYMGSVSLIPMTEIKGEIQHEMKDGVLRMVIPSA